jgi:hypothetical protein
VGSNHRQHDYESCCCSDSAETSWSDNTITSCWSFRQTSCRVATSPRGHSGGGSSSSFHPRPKTCSRKRPWTSGRSESPWRTVSPISPPPRPAGPAGRRGSGAVSCRRAAWRSLRSHARRSARDFRVAIARLDEVPHMQVSHHEMHDAGRAGSEATNAALPIPDNPQAVLEASPDRATFALIALDRARQWLVSAGSIEEVNELRARAEGVRVYTRQAELGKEAENAAAEIRLRAERRVGELLRQTPGSTPGRPTGRRCAPATAAPRACRDGSRRTSGASGTSRARSPTPYLMRRPPQPGYSVVMFRGRHVPDPTELDAGELAALWADLPVAARAITAGSSPATSTTRSLATRSRTCMPTSSRGIRTTRRPAAHSQMRSGRARSNCRRISSATSSPPSGGSAHFHGRAAHNAADRQSGARRTRGDPGARGGRPSGAGGRQALRDEAGGVARAPAPRAAAVRRRRRVRRGGSASLLAQGADD